MQGRKLNQMPVNIGLLAGQELVFNHLDFPGTRTHAYQSKTSKTSKCPKTLNNSLVKNWSRTGQKLVFNHYQLGWSTTPLSIERGGVIDHQPSQLVVNSKNAKNPTTRFPR